VSAAVGAAAAAAASPASAMLLKAASGAGQAMGPLFDRLSLLVGDSPQLMEALRAAEGRAQELAAANAQLAQRVRELEGLRGADAAVSDVLRTRTHVPCYGT